MKYRWREDVLTRRVAGEVLLVPIRGQLADMEKLFVLEGSGEFVWKRLDGEHSLAQIRTELVCEFKVDAGQAVADVDEFVAQLLDAGLVEPAGGPD